MKHATKKTHDTPELDAPEIEAQRLEADVQRAIADAPPNKPEDDVRRYVAGGPQLQVEDEVDRLIREVASKPHLPATRAECETLMDTKHQHIAEAEARLLKAKADLDKLIGHHNNLPK